MATKKKGGAVSATSTSGVSGSTASGSEVSGSEVSGTTSGSEVSGSEVSGSEVSGSEVSGSETSGSEVSGSEVSGSAASSSAASSSAISSSAQSTSGVSSSAASSSAVSSSAISGSSVTGSATETGSTSGATSAESGVSGTTKSKTRETDQQPRDEVFSTRIDTAAILNQQKDIGKGGAGLSKKEEEKVVRKAKEKERDAIPEAKGPKTGRRLYIMRHAERMDRIFPGWTRLAFTDLGKYRPYDLNQSLTLPKRSGGPAHFHNDTPITEMGYVASQMIGRGMRLNRVNVSAIYSSPALRCVQTAFGLLKTLNAPCKIRIEPGLFEWLAWYEAPPVWMSPEELSATGYPIDTNYKPFIEVGPLFKMYLKETSMEHYDRFGKVLQDVLDRNPEKGAILIVGHGTSLDGSRKILGRQIDPLSRAEMDRMGLNYPYCSVVAMEELANKAWRVIHNPIPSITYLDFSNRLNFQFFNR